MKHTTAFRLVLTYLLGAVAALLMHACYGSDVVKPPEGPGTEYPCGVWGVACTTTKPIQCCPPKHICGYAGGFSRCEPGYCCYDGDDWPANASADAAASVHPSVRQTPASQ